METLNVYVLAISFLVGAIFFMYLDRYLSSKGGRIATLLAMMMDFVPESISIRRYICYQTFRRYFACRIYWVAEFT
ncbi:hypothetical protein [Neptunitalea chrysea]|uniref:hypothetical protein n=1 Tax=Neptunitalea chrysea TaxID=1647581 RepID=UPI0024918F85|nr:hypothetical protein [Neptunitalea chrysea]